MGKIQESSERLFLVFQEGISLGNEPGRPRKKPSPKDFEQTAAACLANLYAEAEKERQRNRLGLLGRARVAFHLQQRLVAAGYPLPLVRQILFSMLIAAFIPQKS